MRYPNRSNARITLFLGHLLGNPASIKYSLQLQKRPRQVPQFRVLLFQKFEDKIELQRLRPQHFLCMYRLVITTPFNPTCAVPWEVEADLYILPWALRFFSTAFK